MHVEINKVKDFEEALNQLSMSIRTLKIEVAIDN